MVHLERRHHGFIYRRCGYLTTRLGLVLTFTIMLASQFLLAALFDHFGLMGASVRPLDGTRVIGVVVIADRRMADDAVSGNSQFQTYHLPIP